MNEYIDELKMSDLDLDALGVHADAIDAQVLDDHFIYGQGIDGQAIDGQAVDGQVIHRQAIDIRDVIPDVRDGLTRKQRAILYCLHETQKEFGNRMVPTITLYGRVLEYVDISQEEFQTLLSQMAGMTRDTHL